MRLVIAICLMLTCVTRLTAQEFASGDSCARAPEFPRRFGFDSRTALLTSSESRKVGLFLVDKSSPDPERYKSFQHPSWRQAGQLGKIIFDDAGNVYSHPAPHVNLIDNPPGKSNTIYQLASGSGEMKLWKELPCPASISDENPFGILSLAYSCENKGIYASSVMGSTRHEERGKIYFLSQATGEIVSTLDNFDGFGMAVATIKNRKVLLLGHARSSHVFAVDLDDQGKFAGKPKILLSIAGLGPRGDDKAKAITLDLPQKKLLITGYEFNFNLANYLVPEQDVYEFPLG